MTTLNISAWKPDNLLDNTSRILENNLLVDTLVLGNDIPSLLTAYRLSRLNRKVAIVSKHKVFEPSEPTGVHLLSIYNNFNLRKSLKLIGEDKVIQNWLSQQSAIEDIERIINLEKLDCDFVRESLYEYSYNAKDTRDLLNDYQMGRQLGLNLSFHYQSIDNKPVGRLEITNQAKINLSKFKSELLRVIRNDVYIFTDTEILNIEDGETHKVYTNNINIEAKNIVINSADYLDQNSFLLNKIKLIKSYLLEADLSHFNIAMLDKLNNNKYKVRVDENNHLALTAEKENFKYRNKKSEFENIEEDLKEVLQSTPFKVTSKNSYNLARSKDGLPIYGQLSNNLFVAIAYNEIENLALASLGSKINSDLIIGRVNVLENLYTINRFKSLSEKAQDSMNNVISKMKDSFRKKKAQPQIYSIHKSLPYKTAS